ncbi:hypothetical protein ES707_11993 [subsurface metagenome]
MLHCEIMRDGHEQGFEKYNMWGVTSPDKNDQRSRFKARFSKNVLIAHIPVFIRYVFWV